MNWSKLYAGHISREEIQKYIKDNEWQTLRISLLGVTLGEKYQKLLNYLIEKKYSREAQVRVTNYVTALSRGGLIRPEDYQ